MSEPLTSQRFLADVLLWHSSRVLDTQSKMYWHIKWKEVSWSHSMTFAVVTYLWEITDFGLGYTFSVTDWKKISIPIILFWTRHVFAHTPFNDSYDDYHRQLGATLGDTLGVAPGSKPGLKAYQVEGKAGITLEKYRKSTTATPDLLNLSRK